MADDIVTRLREFHPDVDDYPGYQAADEIVRLRAEVERLTDDMSTMHRTVVHDCCDTQGGTVSDPYYDHVSDPVINALAAMDDDGSVLWAVVREVQERRAADTRIAVGDHDGFGWSSCDACGSRLGGNRMWASVLL